MPDVVARSDALYASGEAGRGFRTMGDADPNCVMVAKGAPFAPAHAPPRHRTTLHPLVRLGSPCYVPPRGLRGTTAPATRTAALSYIPPSGPLTRAPLPA